MTGFRDLQEISEKSVLALGAGDSSLVQGHSGPAPEKEKTMNTSTRKKILTVAGALAIAGALVAGVVTNGSDKKDSTAVEQLAEFEAMLNDGVIDQGTLESFLTDMVGEDAPITSAIKDVMKDKSTASEPQVDAKVTIKDDAPTDANKPAESTPVDNQVVAPPAAESAPQAASAVNEQAGAATTPEVSQQAPTNDASTQQAATGGATSTAIPQWMLDLAKSKTVNILDVYKSWQSNGGTFSGITNTTIATQPTVPSYTDICKRLGTC